MQDMQGRTLAVGQTVAKAYKWGSSPRIEIRTITRMEADRLWLDNSKVPVYCVDRLLILES
jgi:hypothetical protein